jgi:hypothetical protein
MTRKLYVTVTVMLHQCPARRFLIPKEAVGSAMISVSSACSHHQDFCSFASTGASVIGDGLAKSL